MYSPGGKQFLVQQVSQRPDPHSMCCRENGHSPKWSMVAPVTTSVTSGATESCPLTSLGPSVSPIPVS